MQNSPAPAAGPASAAVTAPQHKTAAFHAQTADLRAAQDQRRDVPELVRRYGQRQTHTPAQRQQKIQPGEQHDCPRAHLE